MNKPQTPTPKPKLETLKPKNTTHKQKIRPTLLLMTPSISQRTMISVSSSGFSFQRLYLYPTLASSSPPPAKGLGLPKLCLWGRKWQQTRQQQQRGAKRTATTAAATASEAGQLSGSSQHKVTRKCTVAGRRSVCLNVLCSRPPAQHSF
jgi:hypothetical protein